MLKADISCRKRVCPPVSELLTNTEYCLHQESFLDLYFFTRLSPLHTHLLDMGFLLTKMMAVFGDREHKVVIVGLDNAGKTTILYQFLTKEAVHTSPTIGSNVEQITVRNTQFLVWDIGGQESLRASWYSYYSNTEIVILVVDSTDRERLTVTKEELHRMLAHEDLQNAAILIMANKQDMKGSLTAAEISQCLTLDTITTHSWHVQACCALTGEGLPASLDWMKSHVVAN
ncbi:putative ADP-ribosylation factor-like protein 5C [Thunnus thynnus]|uniref:putative ADP-ribosylation factor-like protein 5C n=2 Tax=Thunnus TaxID=8234 RepID=UPI0035275B07